MSATILIVEDEADLAVLLRYNLEAEGFRVATATSGDEAVERIRDGVPDLILRQLKAALDAYATRNAAAAVEVCNADEEIDALYTSLFRELLTYMMEDPRNITQCTHLLFCTKSLERVGDHATNVAEAAYYLETGRHLGADEQARQQA